MPKLISPPVRFRFRFSDYNTTLHYRFSCDCLIQTRKRHQHQVSEACGGLHGAASTDIFTRAQWVQRLRATEFVPGQQAEIAQQLVAPQPANMQVGATSHFSGLQLSTLDHRETCNRMKYISRFLLSEPHRPKLC